MPNIEQALSWMTSKVGNITYSMANRNGPYSYDCSSAVYHALNSAGWSFNIGNTESMFNDLQTQGWVAVGKNASGGYDAQRGDIFVWGDRGYSSGAFGHTGMFLDPDNIVHCNFGYNGMSINNHDYIWSINGSPTCSIFRYTGGSASDKSANNVSYHPDRDEDAPKWIVESGDTLTKISRYYNNVGGVDAIAKYNAIANKNALNIGQEIYIPGPLEWIVDPGDTWDKIDDYYGYDRGYTKRRNPGKSLTPGTVLSIWD